MSACSRRIPMDRMDTGRTEGRLLVLGRSSCTRRGTARSVMDAVICHRVRRDGHALCRLRANQASLAAEPSLPVAPRERDRRSLAHHLAARARCRRPRHSRDARHPNAAMLSASCLRAAIGRMTPFACRFAIRSYLTCPRRQPAARPYGAGGMSPPARAEPCRVRFRDLVLRRPVHQPRAMPGLDHGALGRAATSVGRVPWSRSRVCSTSY